MNKFYSIILISFALLSHLNAENSQIRKDVEALELNIRVLKEQLAYTCEELDEIKKSLPENMGLYEGTLVGRYELETQIRKQEIKLSLLTSDVQSPAEIHSKITVYNHSILKLLITLHSSNPKFDGLEYFTFQEMEISFPIDQIDYLQISDYKEDSIYPIYKVRDIEPNRTLELNIDGYSFN